MGRVYFMGPRNPLVADWGRSSEDDNGGFSTAYAHIIQ